MRESNENKLDSATVRSLTIVAIGTASHRLSVQFWRCVFSILLSACFVLLICGVGQPQTRASVIDPVLSANTSPQVSVERSESDHATVYSVTSGECTIQWIVRDNEKHVIKHWSQCAAPVAEQLPLVTQLAVAFFSADENTQASRLFWGRLVSEDETRSSELSCRLALAAHAFPGWDAKKGRAKNGDDNGVVKHLGNSAMIYPELKALFERFHKSMKIAYVEKVCVMKAKQLPFFDQLKQQSVKADEKLPFDCMTWFSITDK